MKIAEFFVELLVDADTGALNNFSKGVQQTGKDLVKVTAVFTGALYALDKFTEGTVKTAVALQNLNNQTDLSIDKIQKLQAGGQLADLSLTAEQIGSSVAGLQNNITQIGLGGGNAHPFQLLGISVAGKDAFDVIEDLRASIVGLDNATATNLIQQTGLSPNFINLLRVTNKEFAELSDGLIFLNPKQRQALLEFGTRVTKLKMVLSTLKDQTVAGLMPSLNKLLDAMENIGWMFQKAGEGIGMLIDRFAILKPILIGIGIGIAVAFAPLTAIITAMVLVFEDFASFLQGEGSVIGDMIGWFKELGVFIDGVIEKIDKLAEKLKGGVIEKIGQAVEFGQNTVDSAKGMFSSAVTGVSEFGSDIKSGAMGMLGMQQPVGNASNNAFTNTFNINSSGDPQEVAEKVAGVTTEQYNTALSENNNGSII